MSSSKSPRKSMLRRVGSALVHAAKVASKRQMTQRQMRALHGREEIVHGHGHSATSGQPIRPLLRYTKGTSTGFRVHTNDLITNRLSVFTEREYDSKGRLLSRKRTLARSNRGGGEVHHSKGTVKYDPPGRFIGRREKKRSS